jgi:dTDP-L-rhamnose 4-epimerase
MKVLVTGGAGFIGSHIVDLLVESGHDVKIIDSLVEQVHGGSVPEHLNPDAEFIHADLCDQDAVGRALDGVEAVCHQAAEVGIAQSMYDISRYARANDLGTAVLLEEMVKRPGQFRRLVVASSHSVYGEGAYECHTCGGPQFPNERDPQRLADGLWEFACPTCGEDLYPIGTPESKPLSPTSVYAITKQDQEQFCTTIGRAYDIPTIATRYFNVYGPRQALSNPYTGVCAIFSARLLNDNRPTVFEDGGQSRDFINVKDVARANLTALVSDLPGTHVMNLGTGRGVSIAEIARTLAKGLGKPDVEPDLTGKFRAGDIRHCVADATQIREKLGFEPEIELEDGLNELLGWLSQQDAVDRFEHANAELANRSLVK